jgi:very-short-patch-repair endonuclease
MNSKLPEDILTFARTLRLHQTDAENLLWLLLRSRSLGFKFRRQHPVGRFILDFYCHEAHLAVELDGGEHNKDVAALKDENRSKELLTAGISVIRFWNDEVLARTEAVLELIYQELMDRKGGPHPCPSPRGRGDVGFYDGN